ncbi:MAG: peptidoglycan DD-metalloendopeptidase family protein [Gammaproteobacteria bacterium]
MKYRPDSQRDHQSTWTTPPARTRSLSPFHWIALLLPLLGVLLLALPSNDAKALRIKETALELPGISAPTKEAIAKTTEADKTASPIQTLAQPLEPVNDTAVTSPEVTEQTPAPQNWKSVTVKIGDSLAKIFAAEKLDPRQLQAVLKSGPAAKQLTRIHPGQILNFLTTPETGLVELKYDLNALNAIQVKRVDEKFETQLIVQVPERRTTSTAGTIENSLFLAAQQADLPEKVTMELANIFGWDIDFALDIRSGDTFAVVYEELFLNGEMIGPGNIIAAEFTNRGKTHQALRFADAKGDVDYYAPNGRSMRKAFIRTPVSFSRISSKFNMGRKHPILNRIRAHKGVDYAAPRGTPVKSAGNGKIVHRARKGGYGKTVVIKHGTKYSTLYAHLSRYQRGLKQGSRVRQGQIIGYVGSTGLATGPHLHYEFRLNGKHRNPLTVKLPSASPLPKKYRDDFKQVTESSLALLQLAKHESVALKE